MFGFFKRLFGAAPATPAALDPSNPGYIPVPKPKVAGAMHPLVRAKLDRPQYKARGVGITWDRDGRPKITQDWLDHLSPVDRALVDADLAARGWRVSASNTVERI
jgi:hypothetical protein